MKRKILEQPRIGWCGCRMRCSTYFKRMKEYRQLEYPRTQFNFTHDIYVKNWGPDDSISSSLHSSLHGSALERHIPTTYQRTDYGIIIGEAAEVEEYSEWFRRAALSFGDSGAVYVEVPHILELHPKS